MSWVSLKIPSSKIWAKVRSVKGSLKSRWMVLNKTVPSWKKGSPSLRVRKQSQTSPWMNSHWSSLRSLRKTLSCRQSWKLCRKGQITSWWTEERAEERTEATQPLKTHWQKILRARIKSTSEHAVLYQLVRHAPQSDWYQIESTQRHFFGTTMFSRNSLGSVRHRQETRAIWNVYRVLTTQKLEMSSIWGRFHNE